MTHPSTPDTQGEVRPTLASGSGGTGFLADLARDLRYAVRGIRRNRSFTAVALITIAIGVGATTTAASIAYGILFRSAPIPEPNRMASIWQVGERYVMESMEGRLVPWRRYEAWREATTDIFSGLAGHRYAHLAVVTGAGAVAVDGFLTSGNYFDVLGITPAMGRFFSADDDPVVVLSDRIWRSRFAADPQVIGRTVTIDSQPFTVVAIAPPGFVGTMSTFTGDLWIPLRAYRRLTGVRSDAVVPIGRLAPAVDRAGASRRVDELARTVLASENSRNPGAHLERLEWRTDIAALLDPALAVLAATATLLLLIACSNIAGMTLARAYERRQEVAVRLAIGAGRGRLVRQMLTETLLIFVCGGAGGVIVAVLGTRALSNLPFPINATITLDLTPDVPILLLGLGVAALTGIVFGLGPALRSSGVDLSTSLKEGGITARRFRRGRSGFVVGQVAMATLLLVVAGLFVRSMAAAGRVELGFDPRGVLATTLNLESHGYDADGGKAFYDQLVQRVRALPGVQATGLGMFVPLGGAAAHEDIHAVEGADPPRTGAGWDVVDPGFFDALRIRPVEGRLFDARDVEGADPVVVVNEALGQRLWPGEDPLGRRLHIFGADREVVGVTATGVYAFVYESAEAIVYVPFAQSYSAGMSLQVRSSGSLAEVAAEVRRIVAGLDPNVALEATRTMSDVVWSNRSLLRFLTGLTTLFGAIGLLLAALGIYGLLAVLVAQRRREFGVRMAIGAGVGDVLRLVLGRGVLLAALGCVVGLGLAFATARLIASVLFGVSPFDPLTFASVPLALIAVAAAASAVPARRATRSDPLDALRGE